MKKALAFLMSAFLLMGITACSGSEGSEIPAEGKDTTAVAVTESNEKASDETEVLPVNDNPTTERTLVVVFSATGTTKGIAEKIAEYTDADLYEITAAIPYSDEDRDWTDSDSRCTKEQNDTSVRPEISSDTISLDGYTTIYIGYPIWFGQEPRIMDTFVESYNFDGITVIPFCTSGSSGIGQSGNNLAENAGSGNWIEGKRFAGDASDEEIKEWIDSL